MTAAWKWMLLPDWLKAWPYRQPSDFVCSPADDPDRPDPVALERERLERQKERETPAGQNAERDFADRQAQRRRELSSDGNYVPAGEILTRFPKMAQRLAEGITPPTALAFGPRDEVIKERQWNEAAAKIREAAFSQNGITAPSLNWSHEPAFVDEVPLP